MKNTITFRLTFENSTYLLDIIKYLFSKGELFTPQECCLGEITGDDYIPYDEKLLETEVVKAIENEKVYVIDFLTEEKKKYFHLSIKKNNEYFLKFDITNQGSTDFLNKLVDFYKYTIKKLDPKSGFAHDFDDAKNTLSGITQKVIRKIYWINIYGRELSENINNVEELNSLDAFSFKTYDIDNKEGKIIFIRTCESPRDITSSRFPIIAEALSLVLSKNKKIAIQTPEKKKFDTLQ
jgi:hypothetical protein